MTTLRQRLSGLLATVVILGIIAGLPAVLFAVGANPFSGGLPTLESIRAAFTTPDDGTLALGAIKVVAWASWAFLTVSILLELLSRIRGVRAPQLPGLGLPQSAARSLVGIAAMLFIAVPMSNVAATAVPTSAAPAPPTVVATQTHRSTATHEHVSASTAGPQAAQSAATPTSTPAARTVEHTVRRGETLWSIAQTHLGDGRRYKEIYSLNTDVMVNGPSFLTAGWILHLPAPAKAPPPATSARPSATETVTVEAGDTLSQIALDELGDASKYPVIFEASRDIEQPGHRHLTDPDHIYTGWQLKIPRTSTSTSPAQPATTPAPITPPPAPARSSPAASTPTTTSAIEPAPAQPAPTPVPSHVVPAPAPAPGTSDPAEHLEEDSAWMARTGYGVGALLAAGVLALIAGRRSTQQRRRRPGQRVPLPTGSAALVEQDLRATADQLSVETVDRALRGLAQSCAATAAPLPVVRAARLTATQFDLYLSEPAQLPTPWNGSIDTTVWTLGVETSDELEDLDLTGVPAPYPSLVTVGHDEEDGHVFLDLEHLGALGVTGDSSATREVLAALAVELATSAWVDDIQVTIVGAFPELEDTLQSGRIRYLPSVGRILEDLLHRANADRRALAAAGVHDLHTARVTGAVPDAWAPEIVLLAGDVTDRQRNQLEQLVDEQPRVALAVVTAGTRVGEWSLDLAAGDSANLAVLNPIGLQIHPQRLPAEHYTHLLEIASLTEVEELVGDPVPEPTLQDVDAVPPVDKVDDIRDATRPSDLAAPLPEVTLEQLTPASASAATSTQPDARNQATEVHATSTPAPAPPADLEEMVESTSHEPAPAALSDPSEASEDASLPAPKITVLGPVDLLNAGGNVEPTKRARLLEYATYLAVHPGATHTAIDDAIWPDRKTEDNLNTRNPATSKLRRWVGTDPHGNEYLPRHQAGEGYAFLPSVTTDVDDWDLLLSQSPLEAPTENLEMALALVRGIPFEGTHRKRYAWAEPIKQRLISEIVDASYELGRRRLMDGRWKAAEQALVVGLRIEPAQENLWRLRILAAHESRSKSAESEAIERLLIITEELECALEPETEQLLAALKQPGTGFDQLMANAL